MDKYNFTCKNFNQKHGDNYIQSKYFNVFELFIVFNYLSAMLNFELRQKKNYANAEANLPLTHTTLPYIAEASPLTELHETLCKNKSMIHFLTVLISSMKKLFENK